MQSHSSDMFTSFTDAFGLRFATLTDDFVLRGSKEKIFALVPQPEQGGLTPRGELISVFPSPLTMILSEELTRMVHESLEKALTEKERQVIQLTYWDGIESSQEIAAIMGITPQAAKQCRYRAMKKLRNYLTLVNYVSG